jgi:hypothetical protein
MDPQIMAVLLAMTTDLNEGSPAGGYMETHSALRWQFTCSIVTRCAAGRRLRTAADCQDFG